MVDLRIIRHRLAHKHSRSSVARAALLFEPSANLSISLHQDWSTRHFVLFEKELREQKIKEVLRAAVSVCIELNFTDPPGVYSPARERFCMCIAIRYLVIMKGAFHCSPRTSAFGLRE
jgi:hypothetical protein